TSRALGLRTEASARFERALPPELALAGARRAASLIAELAGGAVHRDWADVYPRPQEPVRVNLRPALIDDVLGTHVPLEESESILRRLNFHVKVMGDGEWDVLPPVFRLDVTIPEDLVEEVGRVYGYDRVPPTLPGRRHETWTPLSPSVDRRLDDVREVLAGAGFTETWNPALVSGARLEELRAAAQLFHPGRCAAVVLDGRQLGYLGELHPTVTAGARLEGRLVAFEIDVEAVLGASRIPRAQPLPRFPAVERDLAVVVEDIVAAGALLLAIKESGGELLEHARAFDEYRGAQVGEGHKSMAFTLTFRSPERTLTDAEVDKVMSEIRLGLEK